MNIKTKPQLTTEAGLLYLGDRLLFATYPAGDCDVCKWPMGVNTSYTIEKQRSILAQALFDERECGPDNFDTVILPDGTEFTLDAYIA